MSENKNCGFHVSEVANSVIFTERSQGPSWVRKISNLDKTAHEMHVRITALAVLKYFKQDFAQKY